MDAVRLRWIAVVVPVLAIGGLDLLTDHEWSDLVTNPVNTLAVPIIGLLAAIGFARFAYGRIDRLSLTLRERNDALERRNAALEALGNISSGVATGRPIDEIFATTVQSARALAGADGAAITLRSDDGTERTAASDGLAQETASTMRSAPLRRGDADIGALIVRWSGADAAPAEIDGDLLASFANEAAVAVERDRLRRELRELAIRGERERIAREMHDGLAQVLGYVNTKAQAIEELLAAERADDARRQLAELSAAARSVYVDVREAILGLTSPVAVERGLVGALEEYVSRYADAAKIAAAVSAAPAARTLWFSPETQAEIFRIVREALTNVRKHASARRVTVALVTEGDHLVVRVADDGVGLAAPAAVSGDWPHCGMRMMRERASAIGADVAWSSPPGAGATFELRVPVAAREARAS